MFVRRSLLTFVSCVALCGCSSSKSDSTSDPQSDASSDSGGSVPYPPPAPDSCITDVTPGHQNLECEGLRFELTVPETCLTKRCGFITDVHGFGMNSAVMNAHSRMQEIATAKGYIVLQPSAPGNVLSSAWSESHDDSVFALMQHVINVWHVDAKRIHFDGYSMGGWMTWRMLCKHADVLASVAPIAAGTATPGCFAGGTVPVREVPILYTHGRVDGLVGFATATPQRDAVLATWFNGVTPEVVGQDTDYRWERWTSSSGNVFEFIQHDWECRFVLGTLALKGHCFPGNTLFLGCNEPYPDGGLPFGSAHQMDWGQTVLQFFIDHPMPN